MMRRKTAEYAKNAEEKEWLLLSAVFAVSAVKKSSFLYT
jgi:hypothetical protein